MAPTDGNARVFQSPPTNEPGASRTSCRLATSKYQLLTFLGFISAPVFRYWDRHWARKGIGEAERADKLLLEDTASVWPKSLAVAFGAVWRWGLCGLRLVAYWSHWTCAVGSSLLLDAVVGGAISYYMPRGINGPVIALSYNTPPTHLPTHSHTL